MDNAKKIGTGGGGPDKILTPVDDEILDIIGNDSPSISGLNVPDSMNDDNEDKVSIEIDASPSQPTPEFSSFITQIPGP